MEVNIGVTPERKKTGDSKPDSYWKDFGITFDVPSIDGAAEILELLRSEFVPDEPIFRSLDVLSGNSLIDKYVHQYFLDDFLYQQVQSPTSVIARNSKGKLIGFRLGKIHDHSTPIPSEANLKWTTKIPFLPRRIVALGSDQIYLESLDYGTDKAFRQLNCKGKIYFGCAVCVAREARGKGLGEELIRKAHDIARSNGCEYTYLLASGLYSQSMFAKLGYKVLKEKNYKEILDLRGKQIVWDNREHETSQLVYFKF